MLYSFQELLAMNRKIYNENMVRVSTLLVGPLAAAYLMAENYKTFGQEKMARQTLVFGAFVTFFIFGTLLLLPEKLQNKVPYFLLPVLFAIIAQFLMRRLQSSAVEIYLTGGGEKHSNWKVARVSGVFLVAELLAAFALTLG